MFLYVKNYTVFSIIVALKDKKQMAAEVAAPFTDEQLHGEAVGKKDIATFIQANASEQV